MVGETVAFFWQSDCERIVSLMTMEHFHRVADFDFDSKCAICRGAFPADEMEAIPLIAFRECQWAARAVCTALCHPNSAFQGQFLSLILPPMLCVCTVIVICKE